MFYFAAVLICCHFCFLFFIAHSDSEEEVVIHKRKHPNKINPLSSPELVSPNLVLFFFHVSENFTQKMFSLLPLSLCVDLRSIITVFVLCVDLTAEVGHI